MLVGIATANLGDESVNASQTATADGLRTGLYIIAAGALLAIPAALALPNRTATAPSAPATTATHRS